MFSGLLDRVLSGFFPGVSAGADEFDNVVSALGINNLVSGLGHWGNPSFLTPFATKTGRRSERPHYAEYDTLSGVVS